ncbi:hypothetical protein GCM10009676_11940 [Prauserella halophila]|uniref:AsnC-like helix-turn-helix protein n=1 Tax=Prauserella halophila TaxID=185641 RepID=A0ABN1W1B0_9PSEU|nr:Lrp/AsnC family transcriptional regulator [Prauserella halophila]MCP2236587.1 hypothetical protein [Prauserella halophila]
MSVTDPVDARLLQVVADLGRASIVDIASRAGLDPREAARRLLSLSAYGLPLQVGVEADSTRLRSALAAAPAASSPGPPGPTAPNPLPPAAAPPAGAPATGGPSGSDGSQPPVDPVISMWGPPQSASWTRPDGS